MSWLRLLACNFFPLCCYLFLLSPFLLLSYVYLHIDVSGCQIIWTVVLCLSLQCFKVHFFLKRESYFTGTFRWHMQFLWLNLEILNCKKYNINCQGQVLSIYFLYISTFWMALVPRIFKSRKKNLPSSNVVEYYFKQAKICYSASKNLFMLQTITLFMLYLFNNERVCV